GAGLFSALCGYVDLGYLRPVLGQDLLDLAGRDAGHCDHTHRLLTAVLRDRDGLLLLDLDRVGLDTQGEDVVAALLPVGGGPDADDGTALQVDLPAAGSAVDPHDHSSPNFRSALF